MKLAQFTSGSGKITVNPAHVVTVRPADAKDKAIVFLDTGGQITVDGTVDEVTSKLMEPGSSP